MTSVKAELRTHEHDVPELRFMPDGILNIKACCQTSEAICFARSIVEEKLGHPADVHVSYLGQQATRVAALCSAHG